jgi:hypothetical protein
MTLPRVEGTFLSDYGALGEFGMRAFSGWLAGRKTYLLAGLVGLVVAAAVFFGQMTPDRAYVVLLFATAGFAVTFRSAIETHHAEVIAALMDVGQLGIAVRHGDKAAEEVVVQDLAQQGIKFASGGLVPPTPATLVGEIAPEVVEAAPVPASVPVVKAKMQNGGPAQAIQNAAAANAATAEAKS